MVWALVGTGGRTASGHLRRGIVLVFTYQGHQCFDAPFLFGYNSLVSICNMGGNSNRHSLDKRLQTDIAIDISRTWTLSKLI